MNRDFKTCNFFEYKSWTSNNTQEPHSQETTFVYDLPTYTTESVFMIFLGNVCGCLGLILMAISHLVIGFSFLANTPSLSLVRIPSIRLLKICVNGE